MIAPAMATMVEASAAMEADLAEVMTAMEAMMEVAPMV